MSEQTDQVEQTENNLQPLTEHLKALRRVFPCLSDCSICIVGALLWVP